MQQFNICYARKSTDESDKQIRSIPDQIQDIQKCYESLGLEERRHPFRIMQEACSAYAPNNRPVFEEIMTMADRGEVARVIVYDPTRLSRNPEDAGRLIQKLANGVIPEIVTVNGNRYNRGDTGRVFMLMVESGISWKSSADTGWKVKSALKKKVEKGETIGLAPLGYKNVGDVQGKRWVEIDDEKAPIVQHIFTLAATGAFSLQQLTVKAQENGLRTKPRRNRIKGTVSQPKPLSKNSINNIIKNPYYKGYVLHKKLGEFKGIHPPLIDSEIWQRANIRISERYKGSARIQKDKLRELFVMRGVVRCGYCNRSLAFYRAKKGRYIMAECKNKCGICMNQNKLLSQLDERLQLLKLEAGANELLRKDMLHIHEREINRERSQRGALEREYDGLQQEIGALFSQRSEAERQGVLDAVDAKLATLKMRRDELQKTIQQLHNESNDWVDQVIQTFELAKLASEAIRYGSPEAREAILKALGSNYIVKEGKLSWKLPSPLQEMLEEPDRTKWGDRWDSNPRPSGPQPDALTN